MILWTRTIRATCDIALDIDRFDFAVRVKIEDARPVARVERCA
jgi:hypothetical protein